MKTFQIILTLIIGFIIGATSIYMDCELNYFSSSPEYQFTVTEDSISVADFGREVGTVKIEGELKNLINKDNE
jgi:hypothetical protein